MKKLMAVDKRRKKYGKKIKGNVKWNTHDKKKKKHKKKKEDG